MAVRDVEVAVVGDDPSQFSTLRLEPLDDDLCWLVLDRPHRLNAMSSAMREEFPAALEVVADGPWKVLLLRGEGRAFSSGADLGDFMATVDVADVVAVRAAVDQWHRAILALRALPQATVAGVHGPTYGGGANLALAADVVVAGSSLRMVQSYVDIGASVDIGGSWLLPRLAGRAWGRRLLLTGEPVDADRAVELGLVTEVVPDDDLPGHLVALGRVLAAKEPGVLRAIRGLLDAGDDASLAEQLDREADTVAAIVDGAAVRAATARYDP